MTAVGLRVVEARLEELSAAAVVRPIRSDLAPVSHASRDLALAAGEAIEERLSRLGSLPLGGAVITPAGALPADFLIHVVVMSEDEPQTSATVQKALKNGLRRAKDWALESLALPPLGIGVGLIEPEDAARVMVEILVDHLNEAEPPLDLTIVAASPYEAGLFQGLVQQLAPGEGAE